jgi:hypothetical protein
MVWKFYSQKMFLASWHKRFKTSAGISHKMSLIGGVREYFLLFQEIQNLIFHIDILLELNCRINPPNYLAMVGP